MIPFRCQYSQSENVADSVKHLLYVEVLQLHALHIVVVIVCRSQSCNITAKVDGGDLGDFCVVSSARPS